MTRRERVTRKTGAEIVEARIESKSKDEQEMQGNSPNYTRTERETSNKIITLNTLKY